MLLSAISSSSLPLPLHSLSQGFPTALQQLWVAAEVNVALQASS